jgi:hypothetical protein
VTEPDAAEPHSDFTAGPAGEITEATVTEPTQTTLQDEPCPLCGVAAAAIGGPEAGIGGYPTPAPSFVYAIGKLEVRFPNLALEKELAQATGRADTTGLTDRQALQAVLARPENRYLARAMCWVMTTQGLETYIVVPGDPIDLDQLVGALRAEPKVSDLDVVIGRRIGLAQPQMCNGLLVPVVSFDQIYFFDREALISTLHRPENIAEHDFPAAVVEVFDRILQITDNAGSSDEHRAVNYVAMRYAAIYAHAAAAFARNEALSAIYVVPSSLSGVRSILDVVFAYTDRATDVVSKVFVRVDVTEEFPFLVGRLSPYFDR